MDKTLPFQLIQSSQMLWFSFFIVFFCASCREPSQVEVTRIVEVTHIVTATPTIQNSIYPSERLSDHENIDCISGITGDINRCAYDRAYQAARELELFLAEVEKELPDWERQLPNHVMSQKQWTELVPPYCRYNERLGLGGRENAAQILDCIKQENEKRKVGLLYVLCEFAEGYSVGCEEQSE